VSVLGWWPLLLARGLPTHQDWTAPGAVVLDASVAADEEALHLAWRRWLQLFNALQCMPGMLLTTSDGLLARDYDAVTPIASGVAPAQPAAQAALDAAWQEVIRQVPAALAPGLRHLARSGAAPPEVGRELMDARGRVAADCELAWLQEQVVILRPDQADLADCWGVERWNVVVLDESLTLEPWLARVAVRLGVDIRTNEGGAA